ncbi:hypothetical protein DPEC_G00150150 [Dallia pectoralis]|uniref:Uncharacterized protein n=1 Tax=Dallia pectoralis TaxID=75939 RepID=A0ACC2GJA0_DALPE|nr:hypothetical protein DPEC_G00150150 [Dallia pectoralis]
MTHSPRSRSQRGHLMGSESTFMKSCLWIALLVTLLVGTKTQDGFDLSDAFDDDEKPTPKVPVKPKDPIPEPKKPAVVPPKSGGSGTNDPSDSDGGDVDNADQPQDLERLWGQFLKMVDDNMPGGVHVWISNIKQAVAPLLEKAMEYLDMGQ